jgi:hypothetical protein
MDKNIKDSNESKTQQFLSKLYTTSHTPSILSCPLRSSIFSDNIRKSFHSFYLFALCYNGRPWKKMEKLACRKGKRTVGREGAMRETDHSPSAVSSSPSPSVRRAVMEDY